MWALRREQQAAGQPRGKSGTPHARQAQGHHTEGPVKPNKEGAYCKAVVALLSSDPRWEADTQGAESPQPLPTPVAQLPNVRL